MNDENIRYYYIWDKTKQEGTKHPVGCVCMYHCPSDGIIYRGISICSKKDSFSKKQGRILALRNARYLKDIRQDETEGVQVSKILSRAGSKTVKDAIHGLRGRANTDKILVEGGKFYARSSFVGETKDGGIPMSDFEASIWDDLELTRAN